MTSWLHSIWAWVIVALYTLPIVLMADFKIKYASATSLTISLASLAPSSTRLVGRESTAVDNSSTLFVDALVSGKITTATATVANTQIDIWVYGSHDVDGSSADYPDVLDGTDSDETFVEANKYSAMRLAHTIRILDTTARTYWVAPFSVAALFGGVMPKKWGLWITGNWHGSNALSATASDHEFMYTGIHGQSV